MKLIGLSLLIVTSTAAVAIAEGRTDINPAMHYYRAFTLAPDLSQADRDYLFNTESRGQKLPERFGELVGRYDNQFKLVRQAAQAAVPCDWGVDMTAGPATMLPHLARCKAVAQTARLRAMWDLQNGRQEDAIEDLVAALTLARNSSRDGILISALVQIAMENILCSAVAENFYQFSPENLKQLADRFDAAPLRGTVAACIPMEKACFSDWLINKIEQLQKDNPGNDNKVMAASRELVAGFDGPEEGQPTQPKPSLWEKVNRAAGGTSDGVLKLLREEDPFFQRMAETMALPPGQYEDQMKQFMTEIRKSSNPLVPHMFSAWEKCQPKEFAVLVELAMVRAAVEYKLQGTAGLQRVADPYGQRPFTLERFVSQGVDRGFKLKSAYEGRGFPEVLIFVEKDGPPFRVNWKNAGEPIQSTPTAK